MTCRWTYDADEGRWVAACGLEWSFETGETPASHHMAYCPGCGKPLVVVGAVGPAMARALALLDEARIDVLPSGGAESPSVEVHVGPVVLRVRGDGTVASVGVGDLEAPRLVASGSGTLRGAT